MPQSIDRLQQVIKRFKSKNPTSDKRSTVMIPYHPPAPKKPKTKLNKTHTDVNTGPQVNVIPDQSEWQLNMYWMTEYGAVRDQLQTERTDNVEKAKEISRLKYENRQKSELMRDFLTRYQNKYNSLQRSVQEHLANLSTTAVAIQSGQEANTTSTESTDGLTANQVARVYAEASVQTEPDDIDVNNKIVDAATDTETNTHTTANETIQQLIDVEVIEPQFDAGVEIVRSTVVHCCPNCDYQTNKKSWMLDHIAEFCVDINKIYSDLCFMSCEKSTCVYKSSKGMLFKICL